MNSLSDLPHIAHHATANTLAGYEKYFILTCHQLMLELPCIQHNQGAGFDYFYPGQSKTGVFVGIFRAWVKDNPFRSDLNDVV